MTARDEIASGLSLLPLTATEQDIDRCLAYLELIARWNQVTNLTAVRELDEMVPVHLMDSLAILPFVRGSTILDVGSGAGLPGIPLALFSPDKDFILLDANRKKTSFMTQATIELGLTNVQVVHSRVEDYRQPVDQVVCRAFTSLPEFAGLCGHLVIDGGTLLAMKGPAEAQVTDLPLWQVICHAMDVPLLQGERYLIEMSR